MSVILYHSPISVASRCVTLTAKIIKLNLNIKLINLTKTEQLKPEYLKINPQHTVPTLDDNGFYLYESRAIATYLVDKYSKDDALYPKDIKERAQVNQGLFFDATTLHATFRNIYFPILRREANWQINEVKEKHMNTALEFLNQQLNEKSFMCGENLTVADLSTVTSVETLKAMEWNMSPYNNIQQWLENCSETIPDYSENVDGARSFAKILKKLISLNEQEQ